MLDIFKTWIQKKCSEIEKLGYETEIVQSPGNADLKSIRIDLDSENYIARITVLEFGGCHMEIINVSSEAMVLDKYLELAPTTEFSTTFKDFFDLLE
jgi:hypothetical protein